MTTGARQESPVVAPPRVDVIVNNFNYAPYLRAAIDSALTQTHPGTRVIVDSKSLESMSKREFVELCVSLLEYRDAYDRMYRRAVKALVLHRFKRLPRGAVRRIDAAYIDQLEKWYRRAGSAKTAESVFEERSLLPI